MGYGLSVNYTEARAAVYKMVMDFETDVFSVYAPENTMPLHAALNMLVTTLGN